MNTWPPLESGFVRIADTAGARYDIPANRFAEIMAEFPEMRTVPGPDLNILALTPEDYDFLRAIHVAAGA